MLLTDTHAHLYSSSFDEDRQHMIQRALDVGVSRFFIPAIDASQTEAMYRLEAEFPKRVFLMCGLHPCSVKNDASEELSLLKSQLESRTFIALGEIGIDRHWDETNIEEQRRAFFVQLQWAKAYALPIVIHCREAFDDVFEVLEQEGVLAHGGIWHCFSGNLEQAKRAIRFGLKLGIGGVVTFKNGKISQFLDQIPLEHIVLETDAPYLAPVPFRGKRNESAYLVQIAEKLAYIYGHSVSDIAAITTANSKKVFGV